MISMFICIYFLGVILSAIYILNTAYRDKSDLDLGTLSLSLLSWILILCLIADTIEDFIDRFNKIKIPYNKIEEFINGLKKGFVIKINKESKMRFINKKNGDTYTYIDEVINCTNSQDGQIMILYTKDNMLFVREKEEFFEKFERKTKGNK